MIEKTQWRVLVVVAALLVALLTVSVYSAATSDEVAEYMEESEEWCDERDGYLVNENAILNGGLYCHFDNGTSVHMPDVIEMEDKHE